MACSCSQNSAKPVTKQVVKEIKPKDSKVIQVKTRKIVRRPI